MPKKSGEYGDQSISALKGPDRVRKRPGVIFGSDGIEGCEHSFFEILSNSIDEAREGYGNVINITVRKDKSITVEDFGRGVPLDWNEKEQRYNWDLIYCELYAGSKYNNDGGWVRVSVNADHKYFYIKVSDSGVGIPKDAQTRIYERFYRVDKARSRETGGTGLGLAITKNVVQLHHGGIKLNSTPGEGTTFLVRIPLKYIE